MNSSNHSGHEPSPLARILPPETMLKENPQHYTAGYIIRGIHSPKISRQQILPMQLSAVAELQSSLQAKAIRTITYKPLTTPPSTQYSCK